MLTGLCSSIAQGPWHLIFDFLGKQEFSVFVQKSYAGHPGFLPRMFLRAQHSLIMQSVHSSPFNIIILFVCCIQVDVHCCLSELEAADYGEFVSQFYPFNLHLRVSVVCLYYYIFFLSFLFRQMTIFKLEDYIQFQDLAYFIRYGLIIVVRHSVSLFLLPI